ncbi:putative transcription factor and/or regulators TTF-type(Zn) family [Arabidopsis thaliana]
METRNPNGIDSNKRGDGQNSSDAEPNFLLDIYDVRNWNSLDSKSIDKLAISGPKRDISIVKGPKNKSNRRFLSSYFTRYLSNRETCDREWLVYSKELDKVFCFCCKLFKKIPKKSYLRDDGFYDCAHINVRLKEHETSIEHLSNMATWIELRQRLEKNETIDRISQELFKRKRNFGKNCLLELLQL